MNTTNTTETAFATITFQHAIPEQRVKDLMCCAWEGGSNYWCSFKATRLTPEADALRSDIQQARREAGEDPTFYRWEIPFLPGAALELEADDDEMLYTLTREKLIAGLTVMATKYPQHFADVLSENDDAGTGDVFLQCCLFGEIVFG
jgi:hypothetical protein